MERELPLIFVLVESALELVPKELSNHPAIVGHARRRGITPKEVLLDRSYHHNAMENLRNSKKRGRPDIVHMTLLEVLGSSLNNEGLLRTYVHTVNDRLIEMSSKVRLPRNYNRFVGLFEQLFKLGKVPKEGEFLLSIHKEKLKSLIERLAPSKVVAFSTIGRFETLRSVGRQIVKEAKPLVMVGGFPHGHSTNETLNLADDIISIDMEVLEAHIVASRIIYEYEVAIGLDRKRIGL